MNQLSSTLPDRVRGSALLSDHVRTHGTAFTAQERRESGMYISRDMKGRMAEVLSNWPVSDVRAIC